MSDGPAAGAAAVPLAATRPSAASVDRHRRAERLAPPGGLAPQARFFDRLGFRLSSLLAVALLPLGLISLLQADAWLGAAREQRAAALMGETMQAAAAEARVISEARGAVAAMAQAVPALLGDEAACDAAMTGLKAAIPLLSVAAYVPRDGRMTCGSDGAAFDYSNTPLFQGMLADGFAARVYTQARGPVSGVSVVVVVHPVMLPGQAEPQGYVGVGLPHAALSPSRGGDLTGDGLSDGVDAADPALVTFNANGEVLTSSAGYDRAAELLPTGVDLAGLAGGERVAFMGRTPGGEERLFAVAPLVDGEIMALGSVPSGQVMALGPVALTPFLFTALMWAASLVVAWAAAERLVTRHMRRLARAIRSFAGGGRVVGDLDVGAAPSEIKDVSQAFLRMTDTILHDEAELEDIVHQKEVLLREVHHRVKNNLQLIASIMNMQARLARSPETKTLMKGLQERVMSLATVHKELYQTTGQADVSADELLGDITRQILNLASGPGRRFRVRTEFAPLRLTPDQAVPLALLLTEALTNAVKYAAVEPGETTPRLEMSLQPSGGGEAVLAVRNSAAAEGGEPPGGVAAEGTGLGGQLIAAFASQLGGRVEAGAEPGAAAPAYALRVTFPVHALRGAEERHAPS